MDIIDNLHDELAIEDDLTKIRSYKIRMVEVAGPIKSVDTENDLKIVSNLIN